MGLSPSGDKPAPTQTATSRNTRFRETTPRSAGIPAGTGRGRRSPPNHTPENGQISGQDQDDIVLDLTPPTGSVEIVDPAAAHAASRPNAGPSPHLGQTAAPNNTLSNTVSLPLIADNYHPGQTRVQLALSATDDLGGVAEMTISNVASFAEAQWEPYAPEKQWWAHDSATATVYVIFRDKAGNQSTVYSDSPPP